MVAIAQMLEIVPKRSIRGSLDGAERGRFEHRGYSRDVRHGETTPD